MNPSRLTAAAWILLLGIPLAARSAEDTCLGYSLRSFVEESLASDPVFNQTLQTYLKAKYQTVSTRAMAAWGLSAGASWARVESTGANLFEPENIQSTRLSLGVQKLFLETGTRVSFSHTQALSRIQYSPLLEAFGAGLIDVASQISEPELVLTLNQPLLKNIFGLADRYPLTAADLQFQAAQADVEEAWENRLAELYNAYFDWTAAYENVQALRLQKQDVEKVAGQVERKYRARVAEKTEWLRARENQLRVDNLLAQAENALASTAVRIGTLRSGHVLSAQELRSLAPQGQQSLGDCEAVLLAPAPAAGQLRLVRKLDLLEQQLTSQVTVAENAGLPQLELVGSVRSKGRQDDWSGAYDGINRTDYSVGLQASYLLGADQATGDLGKAQAGLEEIAQSKAIAVRDLAVSIQQLRATLGSLQLQIGMNEQQVSVAEEKLGLDMKNYRIGRLDTFLLVDSENAVIAARLQRIQNAIQFKRTLVAYLALTDRLLERHPGLLERLRRAGKGD